MALFTLSMSLKIVEIFHRDTVNVQTLSDAVADI